MSRKIITFCITLFLLINCTATVFAEGTDEGKTGSVSVTLVEKNQNEPIVGAVLSVYHIATVVPIGDGNLTYVYTDDFKQLDADTDDAAFIAKLDSYISLNSVPSVKITTDEKGKALCDDLPLGLYFIKQTGAVDGFAPCTPFLVTVPSYTDGKYVYEVNASPKTEVSKLTSITVKKVWNTDASTSAAESVTVQLLKDGNVVETAILNKDNNWQMTFDGMPESDAYSVKEVDVPKGFTATYKQDGYVFTVTNTSTLIQTGQLMWPIPVLTAAGLLLLVAGIILLKKKRKNNA